MLGIRASYVRCAYDIGMVIDVKYWVTQIASKCDVLGIWHTERLDDKKM